MSWNSLISLLLLLLLLISASTVEENTSFRLFFSSPPPLTFFSLGLPSLLGFSEQKVGDAVFWREISACLKTLVGVWGPGRCAFTGLKLHTAARLLPELDCCLAGCLSLSLPLPPTPRSLQTFLGFMPFSSIRTFLGGGRLKSPEDWDLDGLTSGLLDEETATVSAVAPVGWAESGESAILKLVFTLFPHRGGSLLFSCTSCSRQRGRGRVWCVTDRSTLRGGAMT